MVNARRLPLMPRDFAPTITTESGQCLLRLGVGLVAVIYALSVNFLMNNAEGRSGVICGLTYVCYAYAWVWVVHRNMGSLNRRVLASLTLDQSIMAMYLHVGGAPAALWAWGIPFATIGNGLRFGPHYASIGAAIGTVMAVTALGTSPYWKSQPFVAAGIVAFVCILPVYVTRLAGEVWNARRGSERRAAELELVAKTDFLTAQFNRAGFTAELDRLLAAGANRSPLAVMLLDLDGFKAINDTAGHAAGDDVLRQVAHRIRRHVRKSDVLGRLGGDEFGLIVCDIDDATRADDVVQAMRTSVAAIKVTGYPQLRVGVSIGYCLVPAGTRSDTDAILAAADKMMYTRKRDTKDVSVADDG